MKIHFITQGEPFLQALIEGLSSLHEVSESASGAMPTSDTEAVVIAQGISDFRSTMAKSPRTPVAYLFLRSFTYTNFIS